MLSLRRLILIGLASLVVVWLLIVLAFSSVLADPRAEAARDDFSAEP